MRSYEHGGDVYEAGSIRLDFSINLNPLGMPNAAKEALVSHVKDFEIYPDPFCRALTAAIAKRDGIPPDWILCGNGAADLIFRLCLALAPRKTVVPAPTFSEYARSARLFRSEILELPLSRERGYRDFSEFSARIPAGTDLVFLSNPNNPTGALIPEDALIDIAKRCDSIGARLVIDECFLPFTEGASFLPFLDQYPTTVLLRAFTKLYSMAGLRLGYLITRDAALLSRTANAAQVWSVSAPAQIAGAAALTEEPDWTKNTRKTVKREREYMLGQLEKLGLRIHASDANYLLVEHEHPPYGALKRRGILIRNCGNFTGLCETFFRIGLKARRENDVLIAALKEVLS